MNKFAIVFLTAAMTLGSGAALAESNNGGANQAADAGAVSGSAKENLQPNNVDNSDINNTGNATSPQTQADGSTNMSADEMHENSQCKDGKCPDMNKKVGDGADTKTDGTTH
ncbi:YbgS-like family protein [Erwinia sp. P6884]|uniref:YbgS-like family protein n=1 Tax=Erwinia sp. P6884 TaxID=3141450 RepID=UPI00318702F9